MYTLLFCPKAALNESHPTIWHNAGQVADRVGLKMIACLVIEKFP